MASAHDPRQTIEIDPQHLLVTVTVHGFFSPEAAHQATMETRAAIRSLGDAVGRHVTLYDMTDVAPAPPETIELMRMGFLNPVYKPLWARRVAFVAGSPLLRRQIERIREKRPDIGLFKDRAAAKAWLLES